MQLLSHSTSFILILHCFFCLAIPEPIDESLDIGISSLPLHLMPPIALRAMPLHTEYRYSTILSLILSAVLLMELLFYVRWRYLEQYINTQLTITATNPTMTNHRRQHILRMAAKYAAMSGLKQWLCLWFGGCPFEDIQRENVVQFLKWAFFLRPQPFDGGKQTEWNEQFIDFAIKQIESLTDHPFPRGLNPNLRFVHNTDDAVPLSTTYRPFMFYLCLWIAQWVTDLIFVYWLRFEYRIVHGLRVWFKVQSHAESEASSPILLVHGLGVHFMPYIPMISKLLSKSSRNDLVCVEIPWTAMSIWHFVPESLWKWCRDGPAPSYITSRLPVEASDFMDILDEMERVILGRPSRARLQANGHGLALRWTLMGHSYGTFIASSIYHEITRDLTRGIPDEVRLPRLVLMDPVTMCLTQPTTVSFLMLDAADWNTFLMQHLAAKELMIACTLRKYFHWFRVNLYPEDLINEQVEHVVVTAQRDTLIPARLIERGIEAVNCKNKEEGHRRIHHVNLGDMYHAAWLLSPSAIQKIVDAV